MASEAQRGFPRSPKLLWEKLGEWKDLDRPSLHAEADVLAWLLGFLTELPQDAEPCPEWGIDAWEVRHRRHHVLVVVEKDDYDWSVTYWWIRTVPPDVLAPWAYEGDL